MEQNSYSGDLLQRKKHYYVSLRQGTEEGLEARKDFDLSGSEQGAAVGLGRFHTRSQLYQAKVSHQPAQGELDEETRKAFEYSRIHEPRVAATRTSKQGGFHEGDWHLAFGMWFLHPRSVSRSFVDSWRSGG